MSQTQGISMNAIRKEDGYTIIRFHKTDIVKFNGDHVILNSGDWLTATIRDHMNKASDQYGLGFSIGSIKGQWFVQLLHTQDMVNLVKFYNGMVILRAAAVGS